MQMGLLEAVRRFTDAQVGGSPFATAIEGLTILRSDHEKRPNHLISKPALCITVQGAKWAIFGDERFDYKAGQALPARYSQGHCSALPAIMRETCYWLLTGPHGGEFVKMTLTNSHAQRVISASHLLRDRFAEPIRIEDLAAVAQMIPSAFHRQFKA